MLIAMSSLGFVVFGCLWWAISSFSMPVGSHIDQSVDQRTYIQVHPSDLMELVSKKPEIIDLKHLGNVPPSDRFRENMATFDVYIGHWWAIETRLLSLQKNNRTQAVEIICQDAHATPAFSCDFPPEKASSLLSYKPGDTIRIIGRVKFIDTLVSLDECEIGASDSKLTFYRVPKR